MRIGIVVYSQTGHTRQVAAKLKETLAAAGHSVTLDEVTLTQPRTSGAKSVELGPLPNVESYDLVAFGAPVEAFSLTPVMSQALGAIGSLSAKRVLCFVTQGFPYAWLGGNRAVRQMRRLCEAKSGTILGGAVVNWMGKGLDERIANAVERLSGLVKSA